MENNNLERRVAGPEKLLDLQYDENNLKILTYKTIRKIINNSDSKYKDLMRICYLFGCEVSEILPEKKRERRLLIGNNFSETIIDGEDALLLEIPTTRQGGKPRTVAVPLNPKYEPWSKVILKVSEERANDPIFDIVIRTFQNHVEKTFLQFQWLVSGKWETKEKSKKIWIPAHPVSISPHNLIEIREWELGLCHNFNEYDFGIFFGTEYSSDYRQYFKKLISKSDIYYNKDIVEAIKLKNMIFNPRDIVKYRFKEYMTIYKNIKRKYLQLLPKETMHIDLSLPLAPKKGDTDAHRLLKSNIVKILKEKSFNVTFETANFDVFSHDFGIAVECG